MHYHVALKPRTFVFDSAMVLMVMLNVCRVSLKKRLCP